MLLLVRCTSGDMAVDARFLGRRLAYTDEVTELIPGMTLRKMATRGHAGRGGEAACLIVAVQPAG